jgi:hypothetical protein
MHSKNTINEILQMATKPATSLFISKFYLDEEVMNKKIKDVIVNKILIEMDKKLLEWCNQYRLVPKSNEDYRFVVDMRGVNQFMK